MVLFAITVTCLKAKYPKRDNDVVIGKITNIRVFCMIFCYSTLEFIASEFIDPDTCTRMLLKSFCDPYPKWTYRFAHFTGLHKVVARVPVDCAYFPTVISQL